MLAFVYAVVPEKDKRVSSNLIKLGLRSEA